MGVFLVLFVLQVGEMLMGGVGLLELLKVCII